MKVKVIKAGRRGSYLCIKEKDFVEAGFKDKDYFEVNGSEVKLSGIFSKKAKQFSRICKTLRIYTGADIPSGNYEVAVNDGFVLDTVEQDCMEL